MPAPLMQFLQYAGPMALAIYGLITALAAVFAVLGHIPGAFGAFCVKAASALGVVGADVQKLINLIKPLIGAKKKSVPPLAVLLVALVLLAGCTPMAAVVPVTPDNQAQVSSCQSLSRFHNDIVVGDFVLGVADGAAAGVAAGIASSNPNAAKDIGIGTSAGAAVVAGGLVLANYYSNAYAAQQCAAVLGPLPVLPAAKPKPADPPVSVTIVKSGSAQ